MDPFSVVSLGATLGIRPGAKVSLINPPPGFITRLNPLPAGVEFLLDAVTGLDVTLFFTTDAKEVVARLPALARGMAVTGGIWVCYPVGGDRPTGIDEEFIRHAALDIGLVDDKRAHLDALWSALRLVWKPKPRLERPERRKTSSGASA